MYSKHIFLFIVSPFVMSGSLIADYVSDMIIVKSCNKNIVVTYGDPNGRVVKLVTSVITSL